MRLLVAEDEASLSRALCAILRKNNYEADAVFDGASALEYLNTGNYDAAILDIMMPGVDGIGVLRRLRERGSDLPVLLLTARAEVEDKVLGLDSGANDYLTKPFAAQELLARIRAMTRACAQDTSLLRMGNISLNRATFELSSPSGSFRLARKEFQMMEMLLSHPRTLIPTERFMERIWGYDNEAEIHVVWVYISYLRKKLATLGANVQIKVSRNAGYSLEESA
ncbi:MAG TPA: response regulator transcription factor [Candidatus Pullichristensenella stercorigallinarum]|uniref:Stage 0 sporulation protein A homolog n=1 Tax=Candidatus Pullichristensenella stercorigallinarum TaxID=2840909 RepID=A0A9D1CWV7_9FIRM|nr:response regulator transcription factor [Candidatus Pullichristensenella stercorigallinarum]